eukprot:CAMPEP_0119527228 /NCGR_PEP_ID=MMETSP1344-20130328/41680_1 /TAXON_ID=236787 /ORGANISM="Florenciella parvula, Strain CCMP2471" /LENGTH=124 /DNA_ID=CAMNT_0007566387 /DNA_START=378 /DNA_END=752 /DNA_ORIENTATION=-
MRHLIDRAQERTARDQALGSGGPPCSPLQHLLGRCRNMKYSNANICVAFSQLLEIRGVPLGIPQATVHHDILAELQSLECKKLCDVAALLVGKRACCRHVPLNIAGCLRQLVADRVWVHHHEAL